MMTKREKAVVRNASDFLLRVANCLRDYSEHLPKNAKLSGGDGEFNLFASAVRLEDDSIQVSNLLAELGGLERVSR